MPDDSDFDSFGRFVERIFSRAAAHSRAWIAVWLLGILLVATIAAIAHAPVGAYVLLVVVIIVVIFADDPGRSL